jgi:hypothetical protein
MEARGSKKPAWISVMLLKDRSRDLDKKVAMMNSCFELELEHLGQLVFIVLLLTFSFNYKYKTILLKMALVLFTALHVRCVVWTGPIKNCHFQCVFVFLPAYKK